MSADSSMLSSGHPLPKAEKYTAAWNLLLHTKDVAGADQAQAKAWLTYRAVEGEIMLEDWAGKIAPVQPVHLTDLAMIRWEVSQGAAEAYLWILRGRTDEERERGWNAATVVHALGDKLSIHPSSIQQWLLMTLLLAFRDWTLLRDDAARARVTAGMDRWRTVMHELDWRVHPFRYAEAVPELYALSIMILLAEKLEMVSIHPVRWFTAPGLLASKSDHPWVNCLRLTQTPERRLEPEHKHRDDYRAIHAGNAAYGSGPGGADLAVIGLLTRGLDVRRALDFGAGHSMALSKLWPEAEGVRYDFAIPGMDTLPAGAFDMGLSTDVLEHVPEAELDVVLRRLAEWSARWVLIIHMGPARQMLPSGGNAHVTQRGQGWWLARLRVFFPHLTAWQPGDPRRCAFVTWTA